MGEEITARDRIEAHRVAGEAEDTARQAPWAAWLLCPLARLLRRLSDDSDRFRGEDDFY